MTDGAKQRRETLDAWQKHVDLARGVHPDSVVAINSGLLMSVDSILVKTLTREARETTDPGSRKKTIDLVCRLLQDAVTDLEQGHRMPKSGKVEDREILDVIARHASAIESLKKLI